VARNWLEPNASSSWPSNVSFLQQALGVYGAGPVVVVFFVYFGLLALLLAALSAIFRAGLYIYATTGAPPPNMDLALFQDAFRRKG
jgi:hypothetical protein